MRPTIFKKKRRKDDVTGHRTIKIPWENRETILTEKKY